MIDPLFEYRNCPNCGSGDFVVLFDSNMELDDFHEGIETVYMLPGEKYGRHVQCRNCQFVYVNPIKRESRINEDYAKRKSMDASIIRENRLRASKSQVELIKKYKDGAYLLDIGCGEGFFLFNASKAGFNVKGVELSQDAVLYAKREFALDVEASTFTERQFPENYFDVVTLWQVLEHVPQPLVFLKEAYRVLKPGGVLVASTPDFNGVPSRILRKKWWNIRRLHINQFTPKTSVNIFENAGFRDIDSTSYVESISLLMLLIPILRYLKVYESLRASLHPGSIMGRTLNRIILIYPARFDNCITVGFK
ncbi:MAG: class I SAM-dependent methyltransferase [Dehalococcoidia bacterium]|nr:class I SAM-dependent methyltransferase [Dehalococcoidia bacterium]